jgi:D-xylose reductase
MAPSVPSVKLNSGLQMPLVGFGLWKVNNDTCADQVYNAIKAGYRLFDGACDYGNEKECGDGVARAIKDGLVKRSDLFIVSKLWNSFHDGDRVVPIAKKQLADWQVDYFDLFLVHFPVSLKYVDPSVRYPPGWEDESGTSVTLGKASIQETWTAMESLVDQNLAKAIGISNFNIQLIMDLLRYARIPPATLQIEHHPYLQQPGLVKFAKENNIAVTAYSSFGPASFIELDMKEAEGAEPLLTASKISEFAKAHGVTEAQVLLRWATQRGIAVIPKSNNPERLAQNLDCCAFDLSDDEMKYLEGLDRKLKFNDPVNYGHNIPIFA